MIVGLMEEHEVTVMNHSRDINIVSVKIHGGWGWGEGGGGSGWQYISVSRYGVG